MALCPTCASHVVVMSGDEGTHYYMPANDPEHTRALMALDAIAAELTGDYTPDVLDAIAEILRVTGREIAEPEEGS